MKVCNDPFCGNEHFTECYCDEDWGGGYSYSSEWGACDFCRFVFDEDVCLCAADDYDD